MRNIDNLIKRILEESKINRNQVLKAISSKTPLSVEKGSEQTITLKNVIPLDIDSQNIITGETEKGSEITFTLDEIISLLPLEETVDFSNASTNSVKKLGQVSGGKLSVSSKSIEAMDNAKVSSMLDKAKQANVNIDITENVESLGSQDMEKEQSIQDFKSWCTEYDINCGEKKGKDIINYTLFIKNKPIEVFIEPNGYIRIGGHVVRNEKDFKNIIAFYTDN